MANIITLSRIVFSILILFFPTFSKAFYFLYLIAGLSDMLDGYIARRTNSVTRLGSLLDTIADTIFFIVCFIKLIPFLEIPIWIIIWIVLIALIKLSTIIKNRGFVDYHSVLNKIAGFLLFLLPLTMEIINITYCSIVICIVATVAAIEERIKVTKLIYLT